MILTCARHRYNYGNHYQAVASRFLSEIEPNLLTIHRQFEAEDSSLPFPRRSRSSKIKRSQAHSKRRLIIDDEQLDALLHDELDVQDFLNQ